MTTARATAWLEDDTTVGVRVTMVDRVRLGRNVILPERLDPDAPPWTVVDHTDNVSIAAGPKNVTHP